MNNSDLPPNIFQNISEVDIQESRKKVIYWLKHYYNPVISVISVQSNMDANIQPNVTEQETLDKKKLTYTQGPKNDLQLKMKQTKPRIKKSINEIVNRVQKSSPQNKTNQVK